jgi:hypothetical protein
MWIHAAPLLNCLTLPQIACSDGRNSQIERYRKMPYQSEDKQWVLAHVDLHPWTKQNRRKSLVKAEKLHTKKGQRTSSRLRKPELPGGRADKPAAHLVQLKREVKRSVKLALLTM